jgi:hypothetical protein
MAFVFGRIRGAGILLLATMVGAGSAFAPEHAHERPGHASTMTVHRHVAPHHSDASDHPHVDDDDHVVWLTNAWLQRPAYHGPALMATAAIWSRLAPAVTRWTGVVLDESAPPHGPPRAPRCPRAPPFPA